jgi:hypothetical protein
MNTSVVSGGVNDVSIYEVGLSEPVSGGNYLT